MLKMAEETQVVSETVIVVMALPMELAKPMAVHMGVQILPLGHSRVNMVMPREPMELLLMVQVAMGQNMVLLAMVEPVLPLLEEPHRAPANSSMREWAAQASSHSLSCRNNFLSLQALA